MWLKYANAPIHTADYVDRVQIGPRKDGYRSGYEKPRGCWITDDSEHCWREWCVRESFALEALTHKHEVVLNDSSVLILRSPYELDDFTHEFGERVWFGPNHNPRQYSHIAIVWERVSERYEGLIITPYQWPRRMELSWYYCWDCASGCIWKASAIKEIRLLEIDEKIAAKQEADLTSTTQRNLA